MRKCCLRTVESLLNNYEVHLIYNSEDNRYPAYKIIRSLIE